MENVKAALLGFAQGFGTNILEAVAVLLLGIIVIKLVARLLRSVLFRTKVEGTVSSFLVSIANAILALVLFFMIMRIFNIDTSSIVAVVAASGLAVGLALQNSLSNVASGIILLFTKPFKENDTVNIGGEQGVVKKINITTTELLTADNILITIPNSKVVDSNISNISARPTRRLDLFIDAAYESDVDAVKETLSEIAASDERILKTPEATVIVNALNDSSVSFRLRVYVKSENYWAVSNDFLETCLKEFQKRNIEIPYNKITVIREGETK